MSFKPMQKGLNPLEPINADLGQIDRSGFVVIVDRAISVDDLGQPTPVGAQDRDVIAHGTSAFCQRSSSGSLGSGRPGCLGCCLCCGRQVGIAGQRGPMRRFPVSWRDLARFLDWLANAGVLFNSGIASAVHVQQDHLTPSEVVTRRRLLFRLGNLLQLHFRSIGAAVCHHAKSLYYINKDG